MLALSRKSDYALLAMAELACDGCGRGDGCVSSTRLAEAIEAPEALLRNILKDLARAGLLRAERGPFGGYVLARVAGEVTVLDVVEAVDGPVSLARCCGPDEDPESDGCTHSPRCRIQGVMRLMHERMVDVLRGVTVADLAAGLDEDAGGSGMVPVRLELGGFGGASAWGSSSKLTGGADGSVSGGKNGLGGGAVSGSEVAGRGVGPGAGVGDHGVGFDGGVGHGGGR